MPDPVDPARGWALQLAPVHTISWSATLVLLGIAVVLIALDPQVQRKFGLRRSSSVTPAGRARWRGPAAQLAAFVLMVAVVLVVVSFVK